MRSHLYVTHRGLRLAIYHLSVSVISRARGHRVVSTAAARSGSRLYDARYGVTHNHLSRRHIEHCEILAPREAPAWVSDRESLWNRVEAGEGRRDSQLARSVEIGLPVELSPAQSLALLREFVDLEFVAKGMIADISIARSNPNNPHAHILLTLRPVTAIGFGPKARHWNRKSNLMDWRSAWAARANLHLARAGHAVRIDHRTLEAQQIGLVPARKTGIGRAPPESTELPEHLRQRFTQQQRNTDENAAAILEDPALALRAITRQRASFTRAELSQFLQSRVGAARLEAVLLAVTTCGELVEIGGEPLRYTSWDLVEAEKSLLKRAAAMAGRQGHIVAPGALPLVGAAWSDTQRGAFEYMLGGGDCKAIAVTQSGQRDALLKAALPLWNALQFCVSGAAPSGRAARALSEGAGIESQALENLQQVWLQGQNLLTARDVLVVGDAEMIDLKSLERLLAFVDRARAKIVLIGDAPLLATMDAISPLRQLVGAAC